MASETDNPISAKTCAAFCFVSPSMRARTIVSDAIMHLILVLRSYNVATHFLFA